MAGETRSLSCSLEQDSVSRRVTRSAGGRPVASAGAVNWQSEFSLPSILRERAAASRLPSARGIASAASVSRRSSIPSRKRARITDQEDHPAVNPRNEFRDSSCAQAVYQDRDTVLTGRTRLDANFYRCDALELAPRLLGKYLCRDDVVLQITEVRLRNVLNCAEGSLNLGWVLLKLEAFVVQVEAYRQNDSACHARVGVTSRTAPLVCPTCFYVYARSG